MCSSHWGREVRAAINFVPMKVFKEKADGEFILWKKTYLGFFSFSFFFFCTKIKLIYL